MPSVDFELVDNALTEDSVILSNSDTDTISVKSVEDDFDFPEQDSSVSSSVEAMEETNRIPETPTQFLSTSASAAVSNSDCVDTFDLVVVGAGVSGFYALWRILQKQPKYKRKKVLMLDQADMIGGRLRTDIIHKDDAVDALPSNYSFVVCEEGGMRFCKLPSDDDKLQSDGDKMQSDGDKLKSDELERGEGESGQIMPRLISLIKELDDPDGLQTEKFKVRPKGKIDFRRNWYDGTSFTNWYADENSGIWNDIFYLNFGEQKRSPELIFKEIYRKILKKNYAKLLELVKTKQKAELLLAQRNEDMVEIGLAQTTHFWYNFKKYFTWENVPMYKYTMMSLMTIMGYSQGCITMLQGTGYMCLTSGRGNAGTILQMQRTIAAISASDSFYCFVEGFSSLVYSLCKAVKKRLHADWDVQLRHRVVSVSVSDAGKELGNDYSELKVENMTTKNKQLSKIRTKNLILAIPREAFDKIDIKTDYCDSREKLEQFSKLTNSVIDIEMTKINFYFSRSWWNTHGETNKLYGESVTNLPISMVYPFYDKTSDLCALTMYCDEQNSGFWSDLQSLPGVFTSELQSQYPKLVPASLDLVEEALRELRLLFNIEDIPYPLLTTYTRWSGHCDDTLSCDSCAKDNCNNPVAIHQWKRGVDDKVVREFLAKPFARSRVFICNESWSEFQGWVEGSLMAVDEVIQQFFRANDESHY